ncbi:MAG: hypothetical protein NZ992_02775 [Candidatus Korarchaeum sp.]|nr:hypothetical protein [Candidatus Korarchaeum sp.]MDW8035471.1 hypothetical protein [Candidatus Korarchaeum sp.]
MLLVGVMGSRKEALMKSLVRALTSRGYRVATVAQVRRLRVPEELKEYAEAGAGLRMACSTDKVLISSNFPLKEPDSIVKVLSCLTPIEPDAVIFLGFEDELAREEKLMKVVVASSLSEAKQLIEKVSPPLVGVYSERGPLEGGFSSIDSLVEALVEEGIRRRLLQSSPGRLKVDG